METGAAAHGDDRLRPAHPGPVGGDLGHHRGAAVPRRAALAGEADQARRRRTCSAMPRRPRMPAASSRPPPAIRELREAEEALQSLQTQLTSALRQKERLAQLGGAVAKVSHDLRNILTSAQLFTDRIETVRGPDGQAHGAQAGQLDHPRREPVRNARWPSARPRSPPPALTLLRAARHGQDVIDSERLAAGDDDISFSEDVPRRPDAARRSRAALPRDRQSGAQRAPGDRRPAASPARSTSQADETRRRWCDPRHRHRPRPAAQGARASVHSPFQGGARKGGSGLGLAIVGELVRGHGGTLTLERDRRRTARPS